MDLNALVLEKGIRLKLKIAIATQDMTFINRWKFGISRSRLNKAMNAHPTDRLCHTDLSYSIIDAVFIINLSISILSVGTLQLTGFNCA